MTNQGTCQTKGTSRTLKAMGNTRVSLYPTGICQWVRIFAKCSNLDLDFDSLAICEVGEIGVCPQPIQGNESNKRPPHIKSGPQNITC